MYSSMLNFSLFLFLGLCIKNEIRLICFSSLHKMNMYIYLFFTYAKEILYMYIYIFDTKDEILQRCK